jgi:hypothetical protein
MFVIVLPPLSVLLFQNYSFSILKAKKVTMSIPIIQIFLKQITAKQISYKIDKYKEKNTTALAR